MLILCAICEVMPANSLNYKVVALQFLCTFFSISYEIIMIFFKVRCRSTNLSAIERHFSGKFRESNYFCSHKK